MKDLIDTHETMRFEVEGILMDAKTAFGDVVPSCKSQSLRAKRVIDLINALELRDRVPWFRRRDTLENFLILNSAIRILERAETMEAAHETTHNPL